MIRYPLRTVARTPALRCSTMRPTLLTSSRPFTDKMLIGSCSGVLTSTTTIGLFHLLVTPVSATIAASTIATAGVAGMMSVIDGGKSGGTTMGALFGVIIGVMGGAYAKSQKEPWRK